MYHKILPKLDDLDRQEIADLNENNKPEYVPETDDFGNSETVSEDNNIQQDEEIISSNNAQSPVVTPESNLDNETKFVKSVRHMKDKKYMCHHCPKGFTTKYSRARHTSTYHSQSFDGNLQKDMPIDLPDDSKNRNDIPEVIKTSGVKRPADSEIAPSVFKRPRITLKLKRKRPEEDFGPRKKARWVTL